MSAYLRPLSDPRILCLLMAAALLFLLPDLSDKRSVSSTVPPMRAFSEIAQS